MTEPKGRAHTDDMKAAIVSRLLAAWRKMPAQRLGQLIDSVIRSNRDREVTLFYTEDEDLLLQVERFAAEHGENHSAGAVVSDALRDFLPFATAAVNVTDPQDADREWRDHIAPLARTLAKDAAPGSVADVLGAALERIERLEKQR